MVVYGTPGAPDLVAIRGARYLLLEIKAGSDSLSDRQKMFRENVRRVGGAYHVIRSVDDVAVLLDAEPGKG